MGRSPPRKESEQEFLLRQQAEARERLKASLKGLGDTLGHALDPRPLAQSKPWLTVGLALVAGYLVVPVPRLLGRVARAKGGSVGRGLRRLAVKGLRSAIAMGSTAALAAWKADTGSDHNGSRPVEEPFSRQPSVH